LAGLFLNREADHWFSGSPRQPFRLSMSKITRQTAFRFPNKVNFIGGNYLRTLQAKSRRDWRSMEARLQSKTALFNLQPIITAVPSE
jgi:hypothetical protein